MIFRFSLYGFLKNQQYYEPFLFLAFLEKGLSFFQIGLLIAFREVCFSLFEVPSGAVADLAGRRRSMVFCFSSFIVSFLIFGLSDRLWHLFAGMFFFAMGDAFRTGTHKAMIFDWLVAEGFAEERTRVYGITRSWAKVGAALSALIAAGLVFRSGRYSDVFLFTTIPYALGILNFLTYPRFLDGDRKRVSVKDVVSHLWGALRQSATRPLLRRLLLETMCFNGVLRTTKHYLQPVLLQAAVALPIFLSGHASKRTAVLAGAVYCLLGLVSGLASRHSFRLPGRFGGEDGAARALWWAELAFFGGLTLALLHGLNALAIALFLTIHVLQDLWQPMLVGRINASCDQAMAATVLSVESQSRAVFTMVWAPLLGLLVDHVGGPWPVGALGAATAALILLCTRRTRPAA